MTLRRPPGFSLDGARISLTWRARSPLGAFVLTFLGLFTLGIGIFFVVALMFLGVRPQITETAFLAIVAILLGLGAFLLYVGIASFVNRTVVRFSSTGIVRRSEPLPWIGFRAILREPGDVLGTRSRAIGRGGTVYELVLVRASGEQIPLFDWIRTADDAADACALADEASRAAGDEKPSA